MRTAGIRGYVKRRRVRTTIPEPSGQKVPDLLARDFTATAPNRRYVGDITYLPIASGSNLYLATVIDCHSRRLAGWAVADHMRTELVEDALKAAAAIRGNLKGAVFHSDHGSVYCSKAYAKLCKKLGVTQSMGAVGSSADNALAESFNATLKRETLQDANAWRDELACRRQVFRWLVRYNTQRRHSWYRGDRESMGTENHDEWRAAAMRDPQVVRGMVEDYRVGLGIDAEHERADRAAGRRIRQPLLVLWSRRDDLEDLHGDPLTIWQDWADNVTGWGIDSGHHIAEEAPDELARTLGEFRRASLPVAGRPPASKDSPANDEGSRHRHLLACVRAWDPWARYP